MEPENVKKAGKGGPPHKCTEELIGRAEAFLAQGNAEGCTCRLVGIDESTWRRWRDKPRTKEQRDFSKRVIEAVSVAEAKAVRTIFGTMAKDPDRAQWWLTHHPRTRQRWSDAGATRQAIAQAMKQVLDILNAELPDELKPAIYDQLKALDLYSDGEGC